MVVVALGAVLLVRRVAKPGVSPTFLDSELHVLLIRFVVGVVLIPTKPEL